MVKTLWREWNKNRERNYRKLWRILFITEGNGWGWETVKLWLSACFLLFFLCFKQKWPQCDYRLKDIIYLRENKGCNRMEIKTAEENPWDEEWASLPLRKSRTCLMSCSCTIWQTDQVLLMLIDVTVMLRHGTSLDIGTKVIDPGWEVWNPEIKVGNEETRKK